MQINREQATEFANKGEIVEMNNQMETHQSVNNVILVSQEESKVNEVQM